MLGEPIGFFAPPGGTAFERVALAALGRSGGPMMLESGTGGFDPVVAGMGDLPGDAHSQRTAAAALRPPTSRCPPLRLLVSRDGVSWSDRALDDLAGRRVTGVNRVTVTAHQVVVAARTSEPGARGPSTQVMLVGAPA